MFERATLLFIIFMLPVSAYAACADPSGEMGRVVYNSDIQSPQYCDGSDWVAMIAGGAACAPPSSCSSIGDICADGSIFAGFMVYNNSSCEALFVTSANQSTGAQWKNSSGIIDVPSTAHNDGRINHQNREGSLSDFPAFELCEDNVYHSKGDWYLPSIFELRLVWENKDAIDNNASQSFVNDRYWASTEGSSSNAGYTHFLFGGSRADDRSKTDNHAVRCVRRN